MGARTRIGVIGGGQLARMMIPSAIELGLELRVLAEEEGMSASLAATAVGDYRDADTVLAFASGVDVITFDHEHVPQEVLAALIDSGVAVHPGPQALAVAQDKLLMRERLTALGLPVPAWARVSDARGVQDFLDAHGGAAVLKTARGGYDGKGVRVVRSTSEAADWLVRGAELLIEELVDFSRELAQSIARRPGGETALWPVVESVQRDGICAEVIAPAPEVTDAVATASARIAREVAEGLEVTGVLAVELFETRDGRVLVNELAMRPHNSGHWSIEGAVTGQFEQHLRAVADLPLGSTELRAPVAVMVNILGGPVGESLASRLARLGEAPEAKVHLYGKAPRPGRKVGHVTVLGADAVSVREAAREAAGLFL